MAKLILGFLLPSSACAASEASEAVAEVEHARSPTAAEARRLRRLSDTTGNTITPQEKICQANVLIPSRRNLFLLLSRNLGASHCEP